MGLIIRTFTGCSNRNVGSEQGGIAQLDFPRVQSIVPRAIRQDPEIRSHTNVHLLRLEKHLMAKNRNPQNAAPATPVVKPVVVVAAPQSSERSEIKGSGTAKGPGTAGGRAITREQIARRAYEIYAGRGYAPGDQQADWLEAERQLKAGL